jgi:Lysyl oxidase
VQNLRGWAAPSVLPAAAEPILAVLVTARVAIPVLVCLSLALSACGGKSNPIKAPKPPVGHALLPDIAPAPPLDVHMKRAKGRWMISFSSILVNIGKGDLILRASRKDGVWHVEQDMPYSEGGAKTVTVPAKLVWGGDGHHHWHIARVATNRLVPFQSDGTVKRTGGYIDSKTGFCFYDLSRQLDSSPAKAVYPRGYCGKSIKDNEVGMGLSHGWADVYNYGLPGQSVDVTNVPDGKYRLWATADETHWFRETKRGNNTTWVDVKLSTTASGTRTIRIVKVGPLIRP